MTKRRVLPGLVTRRELKGYLFLAPWLAGFFVFFAAPLVQSFIYSLSSVKMTAAGRKMEYVGFANYVKLFTANVTFTDMLTAFAGDALLSLLVILVFSLVIAMMLNQKIAGRGFFRTLFFLPIVVVSGPVLQRLVDESATTVPLIETYGVAGIISELLPSFLARPIGNLFSQLILILWYSGVPILIYMTGLQKIDRALYEAALIDGASRWVVFWKITLPALRGMVLINGVYTLVFLATSGLNEIIAYIKQMMFAEAGGYGPASAMAWTYTAALALGLLLVWLCSRERRARAVDVRKTRAQMRVERLHRERATDRVRREVKRLG